MRLRPLTETEASEAGFFKPTATVHSALNVTLESARALAARTILFQCPAKFQPLPENILNLKRFFSSFDRTAINCVWEPRGPLWTDEVVLEICDELDLWHCVNPFERQTVTQGKCYYRLHGRPRWRYTFEDAELYELSELIPTGRIAYVFFNNITMKQDAERFQNVLNDRERSD